MLRGRAGTAQNLGAFHLSIRGDVGGNNDDLKILRFTGGNSPSYAGIAAQMSNTNGHLALGTNASPSSNYLLLAEGKVQVKTASSGASADGSADELVVEGSGHSGLSILSGTSSYGTILFGDSGDSAAGRIRYEHDNNQLNFGTNGAWNRMIINSSGNVGIGVTNPGHPLNVVNSGELQAEFSGYSHASSANNSRVGSGSIRLGSGVGTTGLLIDYTDQGQTVGLIKNEYVASTSSELRLQSPFLSFYSGTSAAERMRIDSNGQINLGIGQSHGYIPAYDQGTGYTNNLNAGSFGILHRNGYDCYVTGNAYYYKTGGSAGWKSKYPAYKSTVMSMLDGRFVFDTTDSAPGGSGVVALPSLVTAVRIDSDGLKFGTDTAAANALDDYEEGDHTATISCASGSITLYSTYNNLSYTKVGRMVHIQGKLAVQAVSSPTGATTISLPFAVADLNDRGESGSHISVGYFNGDSINTGFHNVYMEVAAGVSYVRPYVMKPSSTAGNAPGTHNLGDGYMATGSDIYLNFTYYTNS